MLAHSRSSLLCVFHLVTSTATIYRPATVTVGRKVFGIGSERCHIREIFLDSRTGGRSVDAGAAKSSRMEPVKNVPKFKLNNGFEIPVLGLGTWKAKPGEVKQAVKDAIHLGYRHIDCAWNYQNEVEIGAAIKEKIAEGVVKREDLYIVSKLWNTFHRPELVEVGLNHSLRDLGLDYLDLYLIHWPTAFKEGTGERYPRDESGNVIYSDVNFCDTWKALEGTVKKGLVRSIGVSNFNHEQLERIMKTAEIVPVTNQIEVHPYLSNTKLVDYCMKKNIVITGYSPLRSPDRLWTHEPTLLEDPVLIDIAKAHNRSVAQVILRWLYQRGIVTIPKSVHKNRLHENLNIFNFELTQENMDAIFGLNRDRRANPYVEQAGTHKEYPFNLEY